MKKINIYKSILSRRLVLTIIIAVVGLVCFGLIESVFANGGTIEVSPATYLTTNSEYDRNPSIAYDGSDCWLFYTKGDDTSTSGVRGTYNPDSDTYVVYYKKAATIDGLSSAAETKLALSDTSRPANFDQRVVSATYFNGKVYAFVSSGQSGTDRGLYYYEWAGSSWSGPTTLIADATARGGHVNVTSDSNYLYIVWESSDGSSDFYSWNGTALGTKVDISNDNQPKTNLMGTTLYVVSIEDSTGDNKVYSATAGSSPSFSSHSTASSATGFYDPVIFNDGTDLYVVTAPYVGGNDQQYLIQTKYSGGSWSDTKTISNGGYGGIYWWEYWPIGYYDGTDLYVFFTTETSSQSFSDGEIAYFKLDWDLNRDHNFYIQNAVDAADSGDTVNVAAETYEEQVTINKSLFLNGAGETTTTIKAPLSGRSTVSQPNAGYSDIVWDYVVAAYASSGSIDVKVSGFTLDANGLGASASQNFTGLFLRDVGDGLDDGLYSSTINNFGTYGANPSHWSGTYGTWMGNYGVVVYDDSELTIHDCDIDEYTVSGISAKGSSLDIEVIGNDLDGTDSDYVGLFLRDGVAEISGNTIHNHDGVGENMGIYLYDGGAGTVIDDSTAANVISDNYIGLFLKGTNNTTIDGNTFTDNAYKSVVIQQDSDSNVLRSNTVSMTGPSVESGIHIASDSGDNVIGGVTPAEGNIITIPTTTTIAGHLPYVIHIATGGDNDVTIQNNTITNGARAVQMDGGNSGTYIISDNAITNDGTNPNSYAIGLNGGDLVVTDNTLAGTLRPLESFGGGSITFTGNTISGTNFFGVNLGSYTGNPVITGNAFLDFGGNVNVVWNQGTGAVNATSNWWGDLDPSDNINNSGTGSIDYSPWWGANYVGDDHSSPWTWFTNDKIQDVINIASAGDIANVLAGIYNERLNINKMLDLRGAQYGIDPTQVGVRTVPANESIITEAGLSTPNPDVLVEIPNGITNVTIDGFTLNGDPTNTTADTSVLRVWDDQISIKNNIIDGLYGLIYKGNDVLTFDKNRVTVNKMGVAVQPNAAADVTISNNTFDLGTSPMGDESALYLTSCTGCDVLNNTANSFTNGNGIGGSNLTTFAITGNTFDGNRKGVNIWGNSTFLTISNNTISNSSDAGINVKGQDITISDNTLNNNLYGIEVDKHVIDTERVTVEHNDISGNTDYGVLVNTAAVTEIVDSEENWWDSISGPSEEGPGIGDAVSEGADYNPWCGDIDCTFLIYENADGEIVVPSGTSASDIQDLIDSVPYGTTIVLPGEAIIVPGGFTISNPGITLKLSDGTVIDASSPCFIVSADDTTITSATFGGSACQPSDGDHGIVTGAAVNNLVIRGVEIDGSTDSSDDGIHIGHDINNLQILDNNIHDMGGDGVEYAAGVTVSGVHEVQGNLFENNTGSGINNVDGAEYNVEYNNWGDIGGPTSGDGASGSLDYDPWTFVGLSMSSSGSPVADKVGEGHTITYTIKMDASQVTGADFDLGFDETRLLVVSLTEIGDFNPEGACALNTVANANSSGEISFCGYSTTAVSGSGVDIFQVVFQGIDAGIVTLDLDDTADTFGMSPPGGASNNIFAGASALEDGSLEVYDALDVTGRIDLQGRADDTGTIMAFGLGTGQGYGPYTFSTSTYWGNIAADDVIEDSYLVTVAMPRYLDVTTSSGKTTAISSLHSVLTTLVLWGGDADDDNVITILDAAIIGGQYGLVGISITDVRADINNDGVIDIFDLVLMGGNYNKLSDTAYGAWTP